LVAEPLVLKSQMPPAKGPDKAGMRPTAEFIVRKAHMQISSTHPITPLAGAPAAPSPAIVKAAREFEAAMLTPLVSLLLPSPAAGEGSQAGADAWHGLMAEAVAGQLASQGGIGLQTLTAAALAATELAAAERKDGEAAGGATHR
jgi:hypothetical protein